MRKILIYLLPGLFMLSCGGEEKKIAKYFDLENFFRQEQLRLQREKPAVLKTVWIEGRQQSRTTNTINWGKELELFRQSDINKPAWKDSYVINRTAAGVSYTAADQGLPTRRIVLEFDQKQRPTRVLIETRVSNNLYSSADTLEYVPGKFYSIRKAQDVQVLGRQVYRVKGVFQK